MNHRMRLDENQVPPAKGKGGRYQPASEYDDATLAQKREYWRNKKREQRARLAKRRGKVDLNSGGRKPQFSCSPEGLSASSATSSSPYLRDDASKCINKIPNEAEDSQMEGWLKKTEVNKVFLSVPAEAADKATVIRSATKVVTMVPSDLSSKSLRNTAPSVPTVRVMRVNNGAPPAPHGSQQERSARQTLGKQEAALTVRAPHGAGTRTSCKETEPKATAPQKLSGEEKAAKRREQWRIKKREQRAKTAARIAEKRQRTPSRELTPLGEKAKPAQGSAQCPPQRSFSSDRHERLQRAAINNMQKTPTNDSYICGGKNTQKKPAEEQRKPPNPSFYSNVTRGISRCKTPRQRGIDVQKNLSNQRNLRCRSQSAASALMTKNIPRIDPRDTPETVIAKRREYWRVKKREQRAKLSMEMKTRQKEKDAVMKRVDRYQQILNEMRKARAALTSSAAQESEAIRGFIREDGTLALNIPQSPTCHHTAGQWREEEHHKVSRNSPIIPQRKHKGPAPIRTHQHTPPLRLSCPAQQAIRSFPRSLSVKAATTPLKLCAPLPSRDPASASHLSRGVKRASVTRRFSSWLCPDSAVSEEMRVARKREYWRTKKREQRAALAARLKLGHSALKRRKAQRQELAVPPQLCRSLPNCTRDGLPLYSNTAPTTPQTEDIKLEEESVQAAEPQPAIKPPASPLVPPEGQQEADPCQGADSQAATLLAVASMKKLLEESLSSVSCTDVKIETVENVLEEGAAVSPPPSDDQRDSISPITADVAMLLKHWQPDDEDQKPNLRLQSSSLNSETGLFPPISTDTISSTPSYSTQSPSDFTESFEASNDRILPCPAQGLSCSTEPPRLHHITRVCPDQQPEDDTPHQRTRKWRGATFPVSQSPGRAGMELPGSSNLQRKREYWKLMKRQQRARLKERRGEAGRSLLLTGSIQINQILQSNLPASSGVGGPSAPPLMHVNQSTKPLCNLNVKLPSTSSLEKTLTQTTTNSPGVAEAQQYSQKWIPRSNEVTCVPSLPALRPPDNPLSSLNLQLYEPTAPSPSSIPRRKDAQVPDNQGESSIKTAPTCTMLPPKLIPGESEKDFLKRKREYWRVKKKEQRAKKAIQKIGLSLRIGSSSWSPTLHPQDLQPPAGPAQGQWGISSEDLDGLKSISVDSHLGRCSVPIKDESEAVDPDGEEASALSATVWRMQYLMDYDPLNQLLVCMVCGELQYSHSLDGVRAHIDEAHPHSMTLQPQDKQQILEAWDEQVSQRERFFSRQLQQNSRDLAGMPSKSPWRE